MTEAPPRFESPSNPYKRIDVLRLLGRLRIDAREVGGGRRLTASCPHPEHDDKAPSWFIRNIPGEPYHAAHACQGCGFRGGPIALVEVMLGLDGDQAREWLDDLTAPPPMPSSIEIEVVHRENRRFLYPAVVELDAFVNWPETHRAYLERPDRAVTAEQVERWRIGFVPFARRHRLAGRIVFPVADAAGAVCGYTARAVRDGERLRYLEPLEDEHPRPCLYGSARWAGCSTVVVVEGVFDGLAVERAVAALGLGGSVAFCALRGSAPRPGALAALARFARVVPMTDPDPAGRKALAALRAACGRHSRLTPIVLPPKTDPAEAGATWLEERLGLTLAA